MEWCNLMDEMGVVDLLGMEMEVGLGASPRM